MYDKPAAFADAQESYWLWCSAYHHQKNTACPEKKTGSKKIHSTLSKLSFVLLKLAQLLIPLHRLKHRSIWFIKRDMGRTINNPLWYISQVLTTPPPDSSFLGYPINSPAIYTSVVKMALWRSLFPITHPKGDGQDTNILPVITFLQLGQHFPHLLRYWWNNFTLTSLWVFQATLLAFGSYKTTTKDIYPFINEK